MSMAFYRHGSLVAGVALFVSFASAQSQLKLIPIPREVHATADQRLLHGVRIVCAAPCSTEDQFAADDLASTLQARGIPAAAASGFQIELTRLSAQPDAKFSDEMTAEGYVISTTPSSLRVVGATAEGLFYGAQTVKQLIEGDG